MLEQKKKPPKRRGFYVRMKLLHNKQEKSCFYTYYKCLLWLSLSLYFFTSYLITNNPQTKPITSSHDKTTPLVPRTLFESTNTTNTLQNLQIFVYDLPPHYNTDWVANSRCSTHLFASEVAIHKALLRSHVRTFDPYEADFFFVPVYVSCNFSTFNGFPSITHASSLIASAIQLISTNHPFWNRTAGSDHVFVASHDFGACFHTLVRVINVSPFIMKNV